jgi:hypothetical protein
MDIWQGVFCALGKSNYCRYRVNSEIAEMIYNEAFTADLVQEIRFSDMITSVPNVKLSMKTDKNINGKCDLLGRMHNLTISHYAITNETVAQFSGLKSLELLGDCRAITHDVYRSLTGLTCFEIVDSFHHKAHFSMFEGGYLFRELVNLTKLVIHCDNACIVIDENTFSMMPYLETLELITSVTEDNYNTGINMNKLNIPSLTDLHLSHINLDGMHLKGLKYLSLNHSFINCDIYKCFPNLATLRIFNSKLNYSKGVVKSGIVYLEVFGCEHDDDRAFTDILMSSSKLNFVSLCKKYFNISAKLTNIICKE